MSNNGFTVVLHTRAYTVYVRICKSVYSTCMPGHSCVVSTAADPSRRPTLELCKHCRWEMCLKLCQKRCFVGAHLESTPVAKINVVVCKAEDKLTLVEIRCPRNYLNMRDQKYIFTHTQHGCNHHPYYTCGFPHSDLEEEIWNVWKGTASANVSHRNAVCYDCCGQSLSLVWHEHRVFNLSICTAEDVPD